MTFAFALALTACDQEKAPLEVSTYDDASCGGGGEFQPAFHCDKYHVVKIVNKGDAPITIKKVTVNGQSSLLYSFVGRCDNAILKLGDACMGSALVGQVVTVDVESSEGDFNFRF